MGKVNVTKIPDLKITQATGIEPLRIGQVAPVAVHIKELNHIDPLSVESLRVDHVRGVDPLRIEQLDVTHLPTVDVSLSRMPSLDLNMRRMPPIALGLQQSFCMPSRYVVHAQFLGVEVLRLLMHGQSVISPHDRVPRERARTHERSFPEVAAAGNPGIPVECRETRATVTHMACERRPPHRPHRPLPPQTPPPRASLRADLAVGAPHFSFSLGVSAAGPAPLPSAPAGVRAGGQV